MVNSDSQIGGASLIKDQAACPFRAFIKHRFRPTEIADPVIGLSAAERGALFHDALFHFWRYAQSQSQLLRLDDTELSALIDSAVTEAMAAMERGCEGRGFSLRERVGASCWDLEKEVLLRVMAEWMALEKSRKEPFVVDQLEAEHSLTLGNVTLSLGLIASIAWKPAGAWSSITNLARQRKRTGWAISPKSPGYRFTRCLTRISKDRLWRAVSQRPC